MFDIGEQHISPGGDMTSDWVIGGSPGGRGLRPSGGGGWGGGLPLSGTPGPGLLQYLYFVPSHHTGYCPVLIYTPNVILKTKINAPVGTHFPNYLVLSKTIITIKTLSSSMGCILISL